MHVAAHLAYADLAIWATLSSLYSRRTSRGCCAILRRWVKMFAMRCLPSFLTSFFVAASDSGPSPAYHALLGKSNV